MAEKTPLEIQIDQEAKELKEAPVIQPIVGQVKRCHICGQVYGGQELKPFDAHIPAERGRSQAREACPNCHPDRTPAAPAVEEKPKAKKKTRSKHARRKRLG